MASAEQARVAALPSPTEEPGWHSPLRDLPANTWVRLKTSGIPPSKKFHGGAAIAPDRNEVFFYGADTHDDDYDNSVFRLNLNSLGWSRDYDPDPTTNYTITPAGHAVTKSGRPWAMHTFDSWDYDPVTRKLLAVSSPKHAYKMITDLQRKNLLKGNPAPATWLYDPDSRAWELIITNSPSLFAYALAWDPAGNQFIGHDGASTYHYDAEAKKWSTYQAATEPGWSRRMVYDTFAGRMLTLGHNGGSDVLYAYRSRDHTWEKVPVVGKTMPADGAAIAYDTHNAVLLYLANDYYNQYDNPSGKSVTFVYDSQAHTWTRLPVQSPELYGMNYLTQYDPVRRIFLHFEKAKDSQGRLAVWAFRYTRETR